MASLVEEDSAGSGLKDESERLTMVLTERAHAMLSRISTAERAITPQIKHTFQTAPEAPMLLLRFDEFQNFGRIPRSSDKDSFHVIYYEDLVQQGVRSSSLILFVSHRWLNPTGDMRDMHPDRGTMKYQTICKGLQRFLLGLQIAAKDIYIWIDYFCIEQDDAAILSAGVRSLPAYIERADVLFTPYSEELCENVTEETAPASLDISFMDNSLSIFSRSKALAQYVSRGWCRLEMFLSCNCPLPEYGFGYFKALGVDSRDDRPHLFFGDREDARGELPLIGPRVTNNTFKLLHPATGSLTVSSDRDAICDLVSLFDAKALDGCLEKDVFIGAYLEESKESEPIPHGFGKMIYMNGAVYEGEWYRGEWEGEGTYLYPDGTVYNGQWSKGKRHGKGFLRISNGLKFDGYFEDGFTHGPGCLFYQNGNKKYEGTKHTANWSGPLKMYHSSGALKYDGVAVDNAWCGERKEYSELGEYIQTTVIHENVKLD